MNRTVPLLSGIGKEVCHRMIRYTKPNRSAELIKARALPSEWMAESTETMGSSSDLKTEFIDMDGSPKSVQVSKKMNHKEMIAEFKDIYDSQGDSLLESLPNEARYIVWQSTHLGWRGKNLTLNYWKKKGVREPLSCQKERIQIALLKS